MRRAPLQQAELYRAHLCARLLLGQVAERRGKAAELGVAERILHLREVGAVFGYVLAVFVLYALGNGYYHVVVLLIYLRYAVVEILDIERDFGQVYKVGACAVDKTPARPRR